MTRLDDLREVRESLFTRMTDCDSDQNFAVMGRLLVDVVKQIDELDPAPAESKGSPLDELKAKRAARGGSANPDAAGTTRERTAARRRR